MKKSLRFLYVLGIITLVLSMSLLVQNQALAGSLSTVSVDMNDGSGNNVSAISTAVASTVVTFDPATAVNTNDGIQINFQSDFNIASVVNGDVTVTQTGGNPTKGTAAVSGQNLQIPITTEGTVPGNAITVTIANSHITTPSVANTYTITITTWDLGADNAFGGAGGDADTQEDSGSAGVLIGTNQVNISGTVEPTLTLAIVQTGNDTAVTTCALGTIAPDNMQSCGYRSKVSTNGAGGYTAYVKANGGLVSGANEINAVSSSPINAGTEEYGVFTTDSSNAITAYTANTCAAVDNQSALEPDASALTTSDQSFASNTTPVSAEYTTFCHVAAVSGVTQAGSYTQTVTITVVGNF